MLSYKPTSLSCNKCIHRHTSNVGTIEEIHNPPLRRSIIIAFQFDDFTLS